MFERPVRKIPTVSYVSGTAPRQYQLSGALNKLICAQRFNDWF